MRSGASRLPTVPGHTQAGIRPAVIVQEDQVTASLPTVLIVPFTRAPKATTRFPGTVLVQPDSQNGLTVPSVALVFGNSPPSTEAIVYNPSASSIRCRSIKSLRNWTN